MKKLFLFATIAAAGLFASCSSSDDAVSDAPNNGIEGTESDTPAIQIGIANLANMATRGTGTVGGVQSSDNPQILNVWAGQKINVFMFNKTRTPVYQTANDPTSPVTGYTYENTLQLATLDGTTTGTPYYNNQVMITPGTTDNLIPGMEVTTLASGQAMIEDGTIHYYPVEGDFNFYGYHGDDAVAADATITKTANKWIVPFTITGSQDLMSTKAELTATQETAMDPNPTTSPNIRKNDYYSAYAARKGVQPTLQFKHLLTRLGFKVKAGNLNATGYEDAVTDADAKNKLLAGALQDGDTDYNFTAYPTGKTSLDNDYWETSGIAKQISQAGGYTIVEVISNRPADPNATYDANNTQFIGQRFAVNATTFDANSEYSLYAVQNNTPVPLEQYNMNMTVKGFSLVDAAAKAAYNATLPGAITNHAAGQNLAKAVKVKKIEVFSKTTGDLAVAWIGDNDDITGYEMGVLTAAAYNQITNPSNNWEADDNTNPTQYTWNGGVVSVNDYASLQEGEKAVANALHGNQFLDANKIEWGNTEAWLTLMERPHAKKKSDAAAPADEDVTGYAAAKTNLQIKTDNYNAAKTQADADPNDAIKAQTLANATADKEEAEKLEASLKPATLMQATISKKVYDMLSDDGKAKYDVLTAHQALNENLIDLTPTAPALDANSPTTVFPQTPVGEALIVAPKADGDYEMKVTIEQSVPTNWNDATKLEAKTVEYPLTIGAPAGGFKQNYSYNVILTVYGLERIEVITVITPWQDTAEPIAIGADD